ncbi:MAG: lmo0937 family membrane protein [Sphingomicrobium sp.]
MLLTIAIIILILWLLGFLVLHVGSIIHLLLVIGVIVLIVHFVRGRGPAV